MSRPTDVNLNIKLMLEGVYYELSRSEEHKRTKPVLVYTMDLLLVLGLVVEL